MVGYNDIPTKRRVLGIVFTKNSQRFLDSFNPMKFSLKTR